MSKLENEQVKNVLALQHLGVTFIIHESVEKYLSRIESKLPGLMDNIFGSREKAKEVLVPEIERMHKGFYQKNTQHIMEFPDARSFLYLSIIRQLTSHKVRAGESGEDFRKRVSADYPGLFYFMSQDSGKHALMIERAMLSLQENAVKTRIYVLRSFLDLTLALMLFIVLSSALDNSWSMSFLGGAMVGWFSFKALFSLATRFIVAKEEDKPVIM